MHTHIHIHSHMRTHTHTHTHTRTHTYTHSHTHTHTHTHTRTHTHTHIHTLTVVSADAAARIRTTPRPPFQAFPKCQPQDLCGFTGQIASTTVDLISACQECVGLLLSGSLCKAIHSYACSNLLSIKFPLIPFV